MLWLKVFHIVFVVSWFAGLFYLPRLFVNLAMVPAESAAERARLILMATKLYRFVTPICVLAVGSGFLLGTYFGYSSAWLQAKIILVFGLVAYHVWCGKILREFLACTSNKTHVWFRFFNEVPVLALIAICILVVVKPTW
jgi:putative membrane protein